MKLNNLWQGIMNDNKLIEPNFKDKGKEFVLATSSSKTKKKHKKGPKVRP